MLSFFGDITPFTKGLLFPRGSVGLRTMLLTAGVSEERSSHYSWHGMKRGDRGIVVLQLTLAGEGELRFGDTLYRLRAGELFFVPIPGDHHYYLPKDSEFWRFAFLCLSGREVMRMAEELIAIHGPVFKAEPKALLLRSLASTLRSVLRNEVSNPFHASRLAYTVMMELAGHLEAPSSKGDLPGAVQRAVTLCDTSYEMPIGVAELAAASGFSRYHFSRRFKEALGVAPGEYLLAVRLQAASALLGDPSLTIKSIGFQSGFRDTNYFCRAFRKHYGQSPGSYRRNGLI